MFDGLKFDGMTDYEDCVSNDFNSVFGSVGYMFYDRGMSNGVRDALLIPVSGGRIRSTIIAISST